MKKILYVVLLLLGVSLILTSCNKVSPSSIEGRWVIADYEYYDENGSLIEKTEKTDAQARAYPYYYFNHDGTGIISGVVHCTYKIENNVITISCPRYEMDGRILKMVNNRLVFEGKGRLWNVIDGSEIDIIDINYRIFYEKE